MPEREYLSVVFFSGGSQSPYKEASLRFRHSIQARYYAHDARSFHRKQKTWDQGSGLTKEGIMKKHLVKK